MKERPILFQGAMVRALLAGTKTQTRRVMKYQPGDETTVHVEAFNQTVVDRHGEEQPGPEVFGAWWDDGESGLRCPYGAPGDRLWVREAFIHQPADYCWEASVSTPSFPASTVYRADFPASQPGEGWRPSIHMPRELSRIQLEITDVRVERLQQISAEDARAEGVVPHRDGNGWHIEQGRHYMGDPTASYASLWESINGPGSWEANPWVWAVSFKRVNTDERSAAPTPLTGARKPNVPDPAPSLEGVRNA